MKIAEMKECKELNVTKAKQLLKPRIYTDFCDRCPNYRKDLTGCCDYIEHSAAWDCVFEGKDIEQAVNEFTCPYNIERLTLTKSR